MIVLILRIIPSTRSVGKIVGWILRLIPSFGFGYGIINIASKSTYAAVEGSSIAYGVYEMGKYILKNLKI